MLLTKWKKSSVNEIQHRFMESDMNCKTEHPSSLFSALPRTEKPQARGKPLCACFSIWKEDWHVSSLIMFLKGRIRPLMWKPFKMFEDNKTQHINRCSQTPVMMEKTACTFYQKQQI